MPIPDARSRGSGAIDDFIRHLASHEFSSATQRIRQHFLDEYLQHAQEATHTVQITVGELMDAARADAWLTDAAAGKIRTRNTLHGPNAAAYVNSMRVRIDSYNAFAEFLGLPDRRDSPSPARGIAAHRRRGRARRRHRPGRSRTGPPQRQGPAPGRRRKRRTRRRLMPA
jgi:hypothetical protein